MDYLTFAIKINEGYGLIQYYGETHKFTWPFYIIYRQRIIELNQAEIKSAMSGEYYYQRLNFTIDDINLWESGKYIKGKEYNIRRGTKEEGYYITYLGKYLLSKGAALPKFSRKIDFSYYTGNHRWYIVEEATGHTCWENGKPVSFKKLIPVIATYPDFFHINFEELIERFNMNFRIEDYNDEWVKTEILEKYYLENPHMRPVKISYEEAKKAYPIEGWKENTEGVEDVAGYLAFCGEMESKLKEFTDYIESGGKSVQKELVKLLKEINKIDEKYHYIESMEAEDLFTYLSKILQSLKKTRLIETIEALREW